MRRLQTRRILATASTFLLLACGSSEAPEPARPSPAAKPAAPAAPAEPAETIPPPAVPEPGAGPADAAAGAAKYATYCASCHGANGDGNTPIAQSLDPKPVAHNDGGYMNPLSDAYLFRVVKEGGAAVGKSQMMAAWGGSLSDADIRNVVAFMRTLADPPYQPPTP